MMTVTKPTFERFVEGCWELAKDYAMKRKDDVPFLFIAHDSINRIHFLTTQKYGDAREEYAALLFRYCRTYDIRMYAVISSAWGRTFRAPEGLSEAELQKFKYEQSRKDISKMAERIDLLTMSARCEDAFHIASIQVFTTPTYHLGPREDGTKPYTVARGSQRFAETIRDSRLLDLTDFKVVPVPALTAQMLSPEALKPFFDLIVIAAPEIERFFHPSDN